jgi:thiol-disulfide isomerase/thioredoxin
MPIKRLSTPDAVAAQIANTISAQSSALFVFFGSEDPKSGASWCPDCVTADPILRSACASQRSDLTLYECPVGERSAWKNQPNHPYRVHPQLRLSRIPTLLFIEHGLERGRLVESDCAQPTVVAAFLKR